jgi:hypothetical protein
MTGERPWRRPLAWSEASAAGAEFVVRPDGEDLAALARAVGAEAVRRFTATLLVRRWLDGVEITGRLRAVVTRICGVSLDPFDEEIDEPVSLRMVPAGSPNAAPTKGPELIVDPDEPDPPDEVAGATIDLAAILTEQLALAMDPFPRKPGAVFDGALDQPAPSPFAALARLKDDQERP